MEGRQCDTGSGNLHVMALRYDFARVYVEEPSRERVLALMPDVEGVVLEVRRSEERPSATNDFISWPTLIELSQDDGGSDRGIVQATRKVLAALADAEIQAVAAAPFEDEL